MEHTARKRREFRKKTRELENKEQTAQKQLQSFRRRSKPLERDKRVSNETREFENKGQTARKDLESFRRRSNPLDRD